MENILFVCAVNRLRSATAHEIYKADKRFKVKSAGTEPEARVVLSKELLEWADRIFVMEEYHLEKIKNRFPILYEDKKISSLGIPDTYHFMEEELIVLLKTKFEELYAQGIH